MPTSKRIALPERDVYLVIGYISQTVNICTPANKRGSYDWIIRLAPSYFVSEADIAHHNSIESLVQWLVNERAGRVEQRPNTDSNDVLPTTASATIVPAETEPEDQQWLEQAMRITEMCIDELVREFLNLPYLHRVEHSMHTRLSFILSAQPHFARHFPLLGGAVTQPIHKEWPEAKLRPEKGNRRGNFDLSVLTPAGLKQCTPENFSTGRLAPAIAIEMGMNYGVAHLAEDAEKLLNSEIPHGYLIHLVREQDHNPAVDVLIGNLREHSTIKVAFARVAQGRAFRKLLDEPAIQQIRAS